MKTLREKINALPAARRRKISKRVDELVAEEMTMRELRKARAQTQETLAEKLGVKQEQVSRLEKRTDLHISTFKNYIEAMGGELEMIAKFPDGAAVKIRGFADL
jgi:DNA-binding XRE family transcriptional regulator